MFTIEKARMKMGRSYPAVVPQAERERAVA
jgi:hypothetical protein